MSRSAVDLSQCEQTDRREQHCLGLLKHANTLHIQLQSANFQCASGCSGRIGDNIASWDVQQLYPGN